MPVDPKEHKKLDYSRYLIKPNTCQVCDDIGIYGLANFEFEDLRLDEHDCLTLNQSIRESDVGYEVLIPIATIICSEKIDQVLKF